MPTGMIMPPPRPWRTRKTISDSADQASPHSAEPRPNSVDRDHAQPLRAEALGHPAGQRDHGRRAPACSRSRPTGWCRAARPGRGESVSMRDVDDRRVEDRHDRAEDDDAGVAQRRRSRPPLIVRTRFSARARAPRTGAAAGRGRALQHSRTASSLRRRRLDVRDAGPVRMQAPDAAVVGVLAALDQAGADEPVAGAAGGGGGDAEPRGEVADRLAAGGVEDVEEADLADRQVAEGRATRRPPCWSAGRSSANSATRRSASSAEAGRADVCDSVIISRTQ